ncbi:MAG: ATP-binding protein [Kiritimatiellia bacterium]
MSIRIKLTVVFLALALIPLLLVGALTFNNYKHSLEANRLSQLRDAGYFKADKIETYFAGLKCNLDLLQDSAVIKKNLPILIRLANRPADLEFIGARNKIDDVLQASVATLGVFDVMLVDGGGKVVYAFSRKHYLSEFHRALPDPGRKAPLKGRGGFALSDIYLNKIDNKPALLVTVPARDMSNVVIGAVAMEVDMAPIFKNIQDVTGLGDTGETLIGKKDGDRVVYLNPLRHDPQAALKRFVPMGGVVGSAIQAAATGHTGVGRTIDYRGAQVVAAWRYIPSLDWGLVAKIDAQEAFADVLNLRNLIFMILGIIAVLSVIMAVSIARSISEPIRKVAAGAVIIGNGNLDYKIGTNLKDEIGQLAGAFDKMTRDLKNLNMARDAERQRLYGVLEALPVYVILLTEDYRVFFANRFFRERFGESHGRRCYEYLFQRREPCENCETYKVLETGARHHWEWTGPDGLDYDIYDFPFTDSDGSRMILEMGIDITARKRAQESLRLASLYARSLIEVSLDPLVTISSDGKITDVNEATVKVSGVPREQLVGTDFSDYFTEPDKARAGYRQVFAQGSVIDYPLTIRRKDGHLTDVLYNASVYKDTHGNVLGVFAAARDVTVLKQAETELRRHRDDLDALVKERTAALEISNKELARTNENLAQFAYVASHDLQEPLRIMANYSQLLEKRYKTMLDKDADDFIDFIVDAAKRMQKLIADLLEYSRAGDKNINMTKVDCNEVLRKVIAGMAPIVASDCARVTHDDLPVLTAHETGLIQLFQNLIGNALKFHGKEPPLIHVAVRRDKNDWVFAVRDNGIGIEPQYKERIFQIFQRLHSRSEYPGTGIGLAICKKIVENHGGRIWVESAPGEGATFYFTIPAQVFDSQLLRSRDSEVSPPATLCAAPRAGSQNKEPV